MVSNSENDLGKLGKICTSIFADLTSNSIKWQRFQSLTKQEKIILKLLAEGITNKEISDQLFISKHTVVTHRKNIYRKLDVNTATELVKFSMVLDIL